MLDWDHLRFMLAIHRAGSMQGAAEALGVDRATVLRRLDALEARLGARLFERRRDGCVLNRAGLDIIGTVEGIADAMTALEHRVGGEDRRAEGTVAVTVPEFFAVKVLAPALPRLAAVHPGITVEIGTGHSFPNLARGEADIALRNRRPNHQSLVSRRVGTVGIGLFASRAYLTDRGTPDGDFAGHDMVLFDETLAGMPGVRWVEEQAQRARILMRSNEILPVVAAARAGLGIGIMPAVMAYDVADLVPVAPGIVGRPEIFLITHRDLRRRARIRAVFDFIVGVCAENAAVLSGRAVAEHFGDRDTSAGFSAAPSPNSASQPPTRPGS